MRKYLILLLLLFLPLVLTGCDSSEEGLVLRVYNWQDYIDEGLDEDGQKMGSRKGNAVTLEEIFNESIEKSLQIIE